LLWCAPAGLLAQRRARRLAESENLGEQTRREHYERIDRLETARGDDRDYDDLLRVALDAGVEEAMLRASSMPVASLDFVLDQIEGGPGLHVGNYAGVSLAYLAARIDGLIVAVDPNVTYQLLTHPQDTVAKLLAAAGVQDRVVLICGYSRSKNPSNQGRVLDGYDPLTEFANEIAPESVLANLRELGVQFGWALLDGNHNANYLRAELAELRPLILPDGKVFLDDCSESWPDIRDVFGSAPDGWHAEATDGRTGVLRRTINSL
jgi:hypothetical protein